MTLKEFGEQCREDKRLARDWRELVLKATDVIADEIARIFHGARHSDMLAHRREEFNRSQIAFAEKCVRLQVQAPADLSIKKFIDLLLQYQ